MKSNTEPTIADIFHSGFENYITTYGPLPGEYYKIAHAIMDCRTARLGGHLYECNDCVHELPLYNSCRNRHCPTCQAKARMQWIEKRISEVLPVPYFHVVFTIPEPLRDFSLRNRTAFYKIIFEAVKETLMALSADPKRLGGTAGFIAILHTWTQTLMYHPHLHCIIPSGAMSPDKEKWIAGSETFLFPVAVMRKLFKCKMMAFFTRELENRKIGFHGSLQRYTEVAEFEKLKKNLYNMDWVVYVKAPFATPEAVIKYLGGYTHRIAISNHRIVTVRDGHVTFSYRDRADEDKQKTMIITCVEFIRRFLMHAVPHQFMRIRHYGYMSNRVRKEILPLCRKLIGKLPQLKIKEPCRIEWTRVIEKLTGNDSFSCPKCKKGKMMPTRRILPAAAGT